MQVFGIVPAAGRSQRMGRPKLLLPWGAQTLFEHVLGQWRASRVDHVIAVVHPDDAALATIAHRAGAAVVVATPPPPDMKSSVRRGLAYIAANWQPMAEDVFLVAPADLPLLSAALIDAVIAAHDRAQPRVIVPAHAGRHGHPVLFPWPMVAEIDRLAADEGLDALLARVPVHELEAAEAALSPDVDTPDDYRRLQGPSPN